LRYFTALLGGHGGEPTLSPYSPTTASHSGHDAGDGLGDFRQTWFAGFSARRAMDHLKGSLVYIGRSLAYTLWHGFIMARNEGLSA
jgi:hypothetical protein